MKKLLASLLVATSAIPASASVVTFTDLGVQSASVMSTSGFTFSSPLQFFYHTDSGGVTGAYDPTGFYMWALATTTIQMASHDAFMLNSFDIGHWAATPNSALGYVLHLADGSSQSGSIQVTASFQTISFNQSVTSIELAGDQYYVALDNLNYDVETPASVPEPAMLGLFGLGAIGLGLSRRRKA